MNHWVTHRPAPLSDGLGDIYWKAAAEHRFVLQRCTACEVHVFPPRVRCPYCWSDGTLEWSEASGRGVVHACSVVHRPPVAEFNDGAPYVVALVDLEEGVRMMSNVVGCNVGKVYVGMPVTVAFDHSDGVVFPVFVPADGSSS